jgi:hypothetical protein
MTFPTTPSDYAMAFHVVSVVPDAERLTSELSRVCKKGATVVVINHFRSRNAIASAVDTMIAPTRGVSAGARWRSATSSTPARSSRGASTRRALLAVHSIAVAENRKG